MNVLALNPGSSTLKFALYRDEELITKGMVEVTAGMGAAAAEVIARDRVYAIGCRVVRGGSRFVARALVDDAGVGELEALAKLTSLSNALAVHELAHAR